MVQILTRQSIEIGPNELVVLSTNARNGTDSVRLAEIDTSKNPPELISVNSGKGIPVYLSRAEIIGHVKRVLIGRNPQADLAEGDFHTAYIRFSSILISVSRQHLEIRVEDNGVILVTDTSSTGTRVEAFRMTPIEKEIKQ